LFCQELFVQAYVLATVLAALLGQPIFVCVLLSDSRSTVLLSELHSVVAVCLHLHSCLPEYANGIE
jgi:hypothetical protein